MAYARDVRATLRSVLWQAAVDQSLPHGLNAQSEHLGARAGEEIDVDPNTEPATDDDDDDVELVSPPPQAGPSVVN